MYRRSRNQIFVAVLAVLALAFCQSSAARPDSEGEVLVSGVQGAVIIYLGDAADGSVVVPQAGDVLAPPLLILTSFESTIDIRIRQYELSIAPGSSVVIPAKQPPAVVHEI